ncbi:hypothetical protein Tco_0273166 [Tanacetum coccineum]
MRGPQCSMIRSNSIMLLHHYLSAGRRHMNYGRNQVHTLINSKSWEILILSSIALSQGKNQGQLSSCTCQAVELSCVTCGGAILYRTVQHSWQTFIGTTFQNMSHKPLELITKPSNAPILRPIMVANHIRLSLSNCQLNASTSGSGTLPGNTVTNPSEDLKGIYTEAAVAYQGHPIPNSLDSRSHYPGDNGPRMDAMLSISPISAASINLMPFSVWEKL